MESPHIEDTNEHGDTREGLQEHEDNRGANLGDSEVRAALDILLEAIECVHKRTNDQGARAFLDGDYELVEKTKEIAKRIRVFQETVKGLTSQWDAVFDLRRRRRRKTKRTRYPRLPRGTRTPGESFRRPILQALVDLGGSGTISEVLDRVGELMSGTLVVADMEPIPSNPEQPRWRNTACWCRSELVREGLMKGDSPRGVWEISDAGMRWLIESNNPWDAS